MDKRQKNLETQLAGLPLYDYRWIKTSEIDFSQKVRTVCEMNDCGMYGKRWVCPPAIGPVDDRIRALKNYPDAFVLSTVAELPDAYYFDAGLKSRHMHEDITYQVKEIFKKSYADVFVLSTGCMVCPTCTYPDAPCRHPGKAFSTIESHGIHIMQLAKKLAMDFDFGPQTIVYFSIIFYATEVQHEF